jgi:hypothetical protein
VQRAIAGVHKFIGNAKLDAARRFIRDAYFGLTVGKVIARAERLNAARHEENARGERERKTETRDRARIQDEAILPMAGVQVKTVGAMIPPERTPPAVIPSAHTEARAEAERGICFCAVTREKQIPRFARNDSGFLWATKKEPSLSRGLSVLQEMPQPASV